MTATTRSPRWLLAATLVCLLGLAAGGLLRLAGIPLRGVDDALPVATGLAAKLACSGRYLSGFDDARIRADLELFSPLLGLVRLSREAPDTVRAGLLGVAASARYYPGLGCTLQYAGMYPLETISMPETRQGGKGWPAGYAPLPAMQRVLEAMLAEDTREGLDTRALLVVQGGRLLGEAYGPGITPDTPLPGWSMGKSVTALMFGRLEALGAVRPGDRDLFPAWSADGRSAITVRSLLQMSSGLAFSEEYVPGNDSTRMLFTAPGAAQVALASPLRHTPGRHFAYSSGTTNLLCRLLSDRLGGGPQGLLDFWVAEVAAPLGLRHTTLEMDASGVFVCSSFVYASGRDWARLALPLLRDGSVGGRQWLPTGWVARARAPNASDNDPRYGYQFWLNGGGERLRWPDLPADAFAMSGHNGQAVMIVPSLDAIFVRLGWTAGEYPVNARFAPLAALLH